MDSPERLKSIELFAWLGEDELGSGIVGLKQAIVPSGYTALVATSRIKIDRAIITPGLSLQAAEYGKKIYLCRFKFQEVLWTTEEGEPL